MDSPLVVKSSAFADEIIRVAGRIQHEKKEFTLSRQLVRAGTSIGANIAEAQYSSGPAEFIYKMQIALRECNETDFWLQKLTNAGYINEPSLFDKCIELKKMLTATVKTARANWEKKGKGKK